MQKIKFCLIFLTFYILNFIGCATAPYIAPTPTPPPGVAGIYHRVEKGETLWRISKIYSVDLDELAQFNHVSDNMNIEIGQLIFVPHRKKEQVFSTPTMAGEDFIWPVKGKVITPFNQTFNNMINKGINIEPYGYSDVVVSRSGKVVFYSPSLKGFGKTIIVDHGDGFLTVYARNSEVFVKLGESVVKGEPIAKIGSAGRDKNAYLHFEIRKGYIAQNPYFYLP